MSASPDIFLSYNREDAEVARRFAEGFEAQGFDVWWDQALRSGEAYDEVTEAALRNAKAVVVLWSKKSVVSRWVRAEATLADRNRTMVPARIEPCDLPIMFELTQTADLSRWQGAANDKAWRAFLADVQGMVGHDAPAPAEALSAPNSRSSSGGAPVVAVLPITHRADDAEMEILTEDLTEEITRGLAQSYYCKVIAATSMSTRRGKPMDYRGLGQELNARYLVEGKLQCAGENARLTLHVIEAASDNMLWSSRHSHEIAEIEASPDEFAASVAAELIEALAQFETKQALAKSGPLSGWEYMLRARAKTMQFMDSDPDALDEARKAVAAAPDLGLAHAMLALGLLGKLRASRLLADAEQLELAREIRGHMGRAIQLDGDNPAVALAAVGAYGAIGNPEAALQLALRATKVTPNSPNAQAALGLAYFMVGRTADAIIAYGNQDRLASLDSFRIFALAALGACLFAEGRSAEAETALDRSLGLLPDNMMALTWKAIVAEELGRKSAAIATIRLLRETDPGKSDDDYFYWLNLLATEYPRKNEAIEILRRLLEETEGNT